MGSIYGGSGFLQPLENKGTTSSYIAKNPKTVHYSIQKKWL